MIRHNADSPSVNSRKRVNIYGMGYAKLFSSITESSLWSEPKETRLLFVTMLAKADATGFVEASVPGLARVANLTMEETLAALNALESPDPHSKNPTDEGRRIVKAPNGWVLINYEDYRNRPGEEERRQYMREYMQDYRKSRKLPVNSVNSGKLPVRPRKQRLTQAEAETEAEAIIHNDEADAVAARTDEPPGFRRFWESYPLKASKKDARISWKKLGCEKFADKILVALSALKKSPQWTKDKGEFIPYPATWLNREGWEDQLIVENPKQGHSDGDPPGWREFLNRLNQSYRPIESAGVLRDDFWKEQRAK